VEVVQHVVSHVTTLDLAAPPTPTREPPFLSGEDAGVEIESDAGVIVASLADPVRFGAIFDRHATVLHRYLVRRLGPDDADTMVGEIFRIAFEKRDTFDPQRVTARPWLYGIATNLLAKHRRREARRIRATGRLAGQRLAPLDATDSVTDRLVAAEQWQRVADAVTSLPERERDALLLHVWEGLSYDDVASALGVPVGTVRSRLNRARRRLRELPASSGGEHDETTDGPRPGRIVS
jgi:RNA polymerase sigma-70 factor (ECF subfamily)